MRNINVQASGPPEETTYAAKGIGYAIMQFSDETKPSVVRALYTPGDPSCTLSPGYTARALGLKMCITDHINLVIHMQFKCGQKVELPMERGPDLLEYRKVKILVPSKTISVPPPRISAMITRSRAADTSVPDPVHSSRNGQDQASTSDRARRALLREERRRTDTNNDTARTSTVTFKQDSVDTDRAVTFKHNSVVNLATIPPEQDPVDADQANGAQSRPPLRAVGMQSKRLDPTSDDEQTNATILQIPPDFGPPQRAHPSKASKKKRRAATRTTKRDRNLGTMYDHIRDSHANYESRLKLYKSGIYPDMPRPIHF